MPLRGVFLQVSFGIGILKTSDWETDRTFWVKLGISILKIRPFLIPSFSR